MIMQKQTTDMQEHATEASELMRQLSNPHRLMILCLLAADEMPVSEIQQHVDLSASALSQHLASLRRAELVQTRRQAQSIFYRLKGDKAARVIELLRQLYCPDVAN